MDDFSLNSLLKTTEISLGKSQLSNAQENEISLLKQCLLSDYSEVAKNNCIATNDQISDYRCLVVNNKYLVSPKDPPKIRGYSSGSSKSKHKYVYKRSNLKDRFKCSKRSDAKFKADKTKTNFNKKSENKNKFCTLKLYHLGKEKRLCFDLDPLVREFLLRSMKKLNIGNEKKKTKKRRINDKYKEDELNKEELKSCLNDEKNRGARRISRKCQDKCYRGSHCNRNKECKLIRLKSILNDEGKKTSNKGQDKSYKNKDDELIRVQLSLSDEDKRSKKVSKLGKDKSYQTNPYKRGIAKVLTKLTSALKNYEKKDSKKEKLKQPEVNRNCKAKHCCNLHLGKNEEKKRENERIIKKEQEPLTTDESSSTQYILSSFENSLKEFDVEMDDNGLKDNSEKNQNVSDETYSSGEIYFEKDSEQYLLADENTDKELDRGDMIIQNRDKELVEDEDKNKENQLVMEVKPDKFECLLINQNESSNQKSSDSELQTEFNRFIYNNEKNKTINKAIQFNRKDIDRNDEDEQKLLPEENPLEQFYAKRNKELLQKNNDQALSSSSYDAIKLVNVKDDVEYSWKKDENIAVDNDFENQVTHKNNICSIKHLTSASEYSVIKTKKKMSKSERFETGFKKIQHPEKDKVYFKNISSRQRKDRKKSPISEKKSITGANSDISSVFSLDTVYNGVIHLENFKSKKNKINESPKSRFYNVSSQLYSVCSSSSLQSYYKENASNMFGNLKQLEISVAKTTKRFRSLDKVEMTTCPYFKLKFDPLDYQSQNFRFQNNDDSVELSDEPDPLYSESFKNNEKPEISFADLESPW